MTYEMTCTGAEGQWWPCGDQEEVFEDFVATLEEFAKEDEGYFGYGDDEPQFRCGPHQIGPYNSECMDCFYQMNEVIMYRIDNWALRMAEDYIDELIGENHVTVKLGDNRIVVRIREVQA